MLLAIDTSTQLLSIALHDGQALLAECTLTAGRQHSALLAPLIKQAMGADSSTRNGSEGAGCFGRPGILHRFAHRRSAGEGHGRRRGLAAGASDHAGVCRSRPVLSLPQ